MRNPAVKSIRLTSYALRDAADLEAQQERRSSPVQGDPIWRLVAFRLELSHPGSSFGNHRTNRFEASNAVVLESYLDPHWDPRRRVLSVGGNGWEPPDTHLCVDLSDFRDIEQAINEYNMHDWTREDRAGYDDLGPHGKPSD